MHDKPDPEVFRFPDVDLTIPKPELRGANPQLPPRSDNEDGIAMFGYLEIDLGPVGKRSIDVEDRPAWPVRPLDFTCMDATTPRLDVLEQIRRILPTFSPEENSLAWCSVVELVRSVGRSAEEARQIGYDELARLLDVHGQRLRLERSNLSSIIEDIAAAVADAIRDRSPSSKRGKAKRLTVAERFKKLFVAAPEFCAEAEIGDIAEIINCAPGSLYEENEDSFFRGFIRARNNRAKRASPQEVFDSDELAAKRAQQAHKDAMGRIDDRIDAEG